MEDLVKLIEIAKKKGQRSIQLVNQNFRKKEISKDNQLYEGIISGEFTSDDTASVKMFESDPGNRNYRNAKSKLKQRLLNHLYFLDYDKDIYTNHHRLYYECLHILHQAKVLFMEDSSDIGMRLIPHMLRVCTEYEFYEIKIEGLQLQRNEYAHMGKLTPYEEVMEEITATTQKLDKVRECEQRYYATLVNINKSVSAQQRVIDDIPQHIKFVEDAAKKLKSRRLDVVAYKLKLLYNQLTWRFKENLAICTELEKKYLNKPNEEVEVDLNKAQVALLKIYCYYNTGDSDHGKVYARDAVALFKNGSHDWFDFMEYHFLLLMKAELYKDAGKVYRGVRTNKNYGLLEDADKERWQIYRAFLVFVNDEKLLKWGFDLDEFLAQVPSYPKDLNNYAVATLVIQFMFLLRDSNVVRLKQVLAEIQQYNSEHLDKRSNYRNSIFIRLISIITDQEFSHEQIKERGKVYFSKLKRTKIPAEIKADMEVIPYDILWGYILKILASNKFYVHYRFYDIHFKQMAEQEKAG